MTAKKLISKIDFIDFTVKYKTKSQGTTYDRANKRPVVIEASPVVKNYRLRHREHLIEWFGFRQLDRKLDYNY